MNAFWMLLTLGPNPTFSPILDQFGSTYAWIAFTRLGLCESVAELAIDCDQPRATADAAASYCMAGRPFA